jgi:DNA-binding HxlR family transcriptional regulator
MHDSVTADAPGAGREAVGSRALSIFARVLSARVLRAHVDGPLTAGELETRLGWAAKASLRVSVGNLCDLGALVRDQAPAARGGSATELTAAGRDLLAVADVLQHWLSRSPFGPISLPDTAARGVVRALVAGWDSNILPTLAERPRSLSELSEEISAHNYPALKRRLSMLRSASLVAPVSGNGRSPAHGPTQWLRGAVGPLSAAGRWERIHSTDAATPVTRPEIEAAFLLALPLLELPAEASGECVLAVLAGQGLGAATEEPELAAVNVVIENGEVVSARAGAAATPTTWALGTPEVWLTAVAAGCCDELRLRGPDAGLVATIVAGLRQELLPG